MRRSDVKSYVALMLGTAAGQGIQLAASLLLTRLYSPAEFGEYSVALSAATVLAMLAVFAYPQAIPLANSDEEARGLTWLAILLSLLTCSTSALLLGLLAIARGELAGFVIGPVQVAMIPLTAFALGAWTALSALQSRHERFVLMGRSTTIGTLLQSGSQVIFGAVGAGSVGLSFGYVAGRITNAALLGRGADLGRPPRIRSLASMASTWSAMPRWLLIPAILNLASTGAIAPWVSFWFGVEFAGWFTFAMLMLLVPGALLGQAITTMFFPRMAKADREGSSSASSVERLTAGLFSISLPVFIPVMLFGEELFSLIFGEEWAGAGQIASVLAPWIMVGFVSSPISSLALVKGRLRSAAFIGVIETIARFAAIAVGGAFESPFLAVSLYSAAGVVISLNYTAWILRLAGGSPKAFIWSHRRYLAGSLAILLALIMIDEFYDGWLPPLLCIAYSGVALGIAAKRIRAKW